MTVLDKKVTSIIEDLEEYAPDEQMTVGMAVACLLLNKLYPGDASARALAVHQLSLSPQEHVRPHYYMPHKEAIAIITKIIKNSQLDCHLWSEETCKELATEIVIELAVSDLFLMSFAT